MYFVLNNQLNVQFASRVEDIVQRSVHVKLMNASIPTYEGMSFVTDSSSKPLVQIRGYNFQKIM